MTCVVGLVKDGTIYMGADRAAFGGNVVRARADAKVFRRNSRTGDLLIGYTTSFRMGQVLQYEVSIPQRAEDEDVMGYMVTKFVAQVRRALQEGGWAKKENEVESGGSFLVGYAGQLFCIQSDYQVERVVEPYTAIGTGEEFALGSLWSTGHMRPKDRIRKALEAAERFNPYVLRPFDILELAKSEVGDESARERTG